MANAAQSEAPRLQARYGQPWAQSLRLILVNEGYLATIAVKQLVGGGFIEGNPGILDG